MASRKDLRKKIRLISAYKSARPAPRWADIRKFGLARARFRSIQRFRRRHWRRGKIKK